MAQAEFEEIVDTFSFLEDWEDRYRHIIDMGKAMPPLAEGERTASTRVEGCASQVWLVPDITGKGGDAVMTFRGDSDAMIVRGLIATLIALYSGLSASEVLGVDAAAEMRRLELDGHLSAQRSNGLRAMVERVRALAVAAQDSAA